MSRYGYGLAAASWMPAWLGATLAFATASPDLTAAEPVQVILDTDISPDVDDVGAVAILHALADLGEARIVAMGACTSSPWGAPCLDALNTYYGRPDIPIGTLKHEGFLEASSYNETIAREFPHDLRDGRQAPSAVDVYRRALEASEDHSITFIAIGPLNNVRALLDSAADDVSPLSGETLVRAKVRELVVMGPYFDDRGAFLSAWNFVQSPDDAVHVVNRWPTPIRYGEGRLGHRHAIGAGLAATPASNPVRRAYALAEGPAGKRHCADPSTILYAVRGTRHFDEVRGGYCDVRPADGFTRWVAAPDRPQAYNREKLPVAELEGIMEKLLVKAPAAKSPSGP